MAFEIERKFLVKGDAWRGLAEPQSPSLPPPCVFALAPRHDLTWGGNPCISPEAVRKEIKIVRMDRMQGG